jgi:biotin carboxyl carrier protein
MKLKAQLQDTESEIVIDPSDEGLSACVDGRSYELELRELENGEYLLFNDSRVFRCRVSGTNNDFGVSVGGRDYEINIVDPKRLRSGHVTGAHEHGAAEIVSPMPGKVVRILVHEGEQVEAGQGVVVVEAMKMQNELKTPKAGVVTTIKAEPGATVNAGDVLAVIE